MMFEGIQWSEFLLWLALVTAVYYSVIGLIYRKELLQWLERIRGKVN
jgi:hypothetical protein